LAAPVAVTVVSILEKWACLPIESPTTIIALYLPDSVVFGSPVSELEKDWDWTGQKQVWTSLDWSFDR